MGAGNEKTEGAKGNNFNYQFRHLQALGLLVDQLTAIEGNTDGLEGTLSQMLAAMQAGKDFEAAFVRDADEDVWLEIRTLDEDSGIWSISYFLPGSTTPHQLQPGDPSGPLAPLIYESQGSVLASILAEIINVKTEIQQLVSDNQAYNTGVITPTVLAPGLPYSTSGNEFSVTVIVTAGTVTINGATIPIGTTLKFEGSSSSETIDAFTIADGTGGAILLILLSK